MLGPAQPICEQSDLAIAGNQPLNRLLERLGVCRSAHRYTGTCNTCALSHFLVPEGLAIGYSVFLHCDRQPFQRGPRSLASMVSNSSCQVLGSGTADTPKPRNADTGFGPRATTVTLPKASTSCARELWCF